MQFRPQALQVYTKDPLQGDPSLNFKKCDVIIGNTIEQRVLDTDTGKQRS